MHISRISTSFGDDATDWYGIIFLQTIVLDFNLLPLLVPEIQALLPSIAPTISRSYGFPGAQVLENLVDKCHWTQMSIHIVYSQEKVLPRQMSFRRSIPCKWKTRGIMEGRASPKCPSQSCTRHKLLQRASVVHRQGMHADFSVWWSKNINLKLTFQSPVTQQTPYTKYKWDLINPEPWKCEKQNHHQKPRKWKLYITTR